MTSDKKSGHAQLIERSYQAFRENDLDALLALYHPEAVWDMTRWENFPEAKIFSGLDGTRKLLLILRESFGEFDVRPEEIVEIAGDRVLVIAELTVRGRASGAEVEAPAFGQIIEFRGGLISRVDAYSDPQAARSAARQPAD